MTPDFAARGFPSRLSRPRSLRARLTLAFTLLIALLLSGTDVVLLLYSREGASRHADRALREAIGMTRKAIADADDEAREAADENPSRPAAFDLPGAVLRDLRQPLLEEQMAVLLIDREGRALRLGDARGNPAWTGAGKSGGGDGWRIRAVPLAGAGSGGASGLRAAYVAYPWWRAQAELRERTAGLALLSGCAVLATAVGAWVLVGGTLRPIDLLARQASDAATPRMGRRALLVPPSPDVEVVRLVETLNRLLVSVGESADARGRFYAAASHELRTPLHVLAGQAELTLSRPRTGEAYRSALVEVGEQASRLTRLVESLLLLNRLERQTDTAGAAVLAGDVVAMCHRTRREQAETTARRDLAVSLQTGDFSHDLTVVGESAHAEILLRNLIDNALRHAPVGGAVRLRLYAPHAGGLGFECENDVSDDVSNTAVGRLGEPFFRPDPSRAAGTGGNGLGLAICRALSDANGWALTLHVEHSVFRARVLFPEANA